MPVGVNIDDADFNTPEKMGGAKAPNIIVNSSGATTTGGTAISIAQMPSHNHYLERADNGSGNWRSLSTGITGDTSGDYLGFATSVTLFAQAQTRVGYAGANQAHTHPQTAHTHTGTVNAVPPYITCYMWKRTK